MFQLTFVLTSGLALLTLIFYHTVGKGLERKHLARKAALLERIKTEQNMKESDSEKGGKVNEAIEMEEQVGSEVKEVEGGEGLTVAEEGAPRKRTSIWREDSYGDILDQTHPIGHDAIGVL